MEKLLITGGSGLLGSNIAKIGTSRFKIMATYHTHPVDIEGVRCVKADLRKKEDLEILRDFAPKAIIHCAALTNIDVCEDDPDAAYSHNVIASKHMAEVARDIGAYLIHISTDNVFDGEKGNYKETDATNPLNVYGRTKLEAEKEVLSADPSACIVRTNIFGWNKLNKLSLAEWMIATLEQSKELPGFTDAVFSSILVNDLAEILFELFEKQPAGIVHIGSRDFCTKYEFAQKIADLYGFNKDLIKPVSSQDVGLRAPRARNLSLDVSKIRSMLSFPLPDIQGGLQRMKELRNAHYVTGLKNG